MYFLNGKELKIGEPFEHNGFQYPSTWLFTSSKEEKASLGIIEIKEKVALDSRFYWNIEQSPGNITAVPKDVEEVKKDLISKMKSEANSILSATDWKVIRALETGVELDATLVEFRQNIRNKTNELEKKINEASTIEQLIQVSKLISIV